MGVLGLGLKLKNVLKSKKGLRKTPLNFGKTSPTITSLKGKYNIGSAAKIKSKAAKAKLESAKFHLERTFSKTDKSIKKLKKTTEETKRYLLNLPPKKTKSKVKHYTAPKDFKW